MEKTRWSNHGRKTPASLKRTMDLCDRHHKKGIFADGQGEGPVEVWQGDSARRGKVAASTCGREALEGDHLNGMQVYGDGTACIQHWAQHAFIRDASEDNIEMYSRAENKI